MSEFAVKNDRRRARLFATTGMLDAVSLIISSFSFPQSPKIISDVTITAVATTTTNSPPPPHVAPVNFRTTTSLPPSPLRAHGLTALRSVPTILLRRLPPLCVQPCPRCAWSPPRPDFPFFRCLPLQRPTLVRANADFIACIPQSGDVPLYNGEVVHALVQTVAVPLVLNQAYAISSYTSTYVRCVLRFDCSLLTRCALGGKGYVFIVQSVYSMDDAVAPLRAMLHSMNEVFSAGNACSRGPQVIFDQLQQYLVFLTSFLNAITSAPVRSLPPVCKV